MKYFHHLTSDNLYRMARELELMEFEERFIECYGEECRVNLEEQDEKENLPFVLCTDIDEDYDIRVTAVERKKSNDSYLMAIYFDYPFNGIISPCSVGMCQLDFISSHFTKQQDNGTENI